MCTPHPSYRSHLLFTEALPRPCCNEGAFVSSIMERIYRRRPTFQENPNIPYCSVFESCHYVRFRCQEYMQKKAVFCCFYKELRPPKLFWGISFSSRGVTYAFPFSFYPSWGKRGIVHLDEIRSKLFAVGPGSAKKHFTLFL